MQYQLILMPGNSFQITVDGHQGAITIDHPAQGPATAVVSTGADAASLTRLFQFQPLPVEAARRNGGQPQ